MTHAIGNDSEITVWIRAALPAEWQQAGEPTVGIDRDEVTVVIQLAAPEVDDESLAPAAVEGRVVGFREDTRERRMGIAREAEHRFGRKVSWGVACGGRTTMFTHLAVPVMTRLRQPERRVLDTLIGAGVARSRSEALAWCVRLVDQHSGDWLVSLRDAMADVERLRAEGPDVT